MALDDTTAQTLAQIEAEAEIAAGEVTALTKRASGYLGVYHESNGVCRFALVAAHGALWASWYLVCAQLAAGVFACVDPTCRLGIRTRFRQFNAYVSVLKDINQRVMLQTYTLIHTVKRLGPDMAVEAGYPEDLVQDYSRFMDVGGSEVELCDLYHRHFLWEQDRVVSDMLDDAFAAFEWPFMRNLCQRPWVWFSYFRVGRSMNFRSFTDKDERVEKGLIAYDTAKAFGFDTLAKKLGRQLSWWLKTSG